MLNKIKMKLPKAKKINAEKYSVGLSLYKSKIAKIKLSANESALGPSPKAIKEYIKVSKNFKRYPDTDGISLRKAIAKVLRRGNDFNLPCVVVLFSVTVHRLQGLTLPDFPR